VIFGINTTRDISKLSQISLASAREILVNNFETNITTKRAITYTNIQLAILLTRNLLGAKSDRESQKFIS